MPRFTIRIPARQLVLLLFVLSACLMATGLAHAEDPDLQLTQVSNRVNVVDIANAGDGSGRLFLVQQAGRILIVENGVTLDRPFLDIQNLVESGDNEQGLLSLAFAPDYKTSGYFYVWYTAGGGGTVLNRFRVSSDPNVADSQSQQIVLTVPQPFGNHNGGRLRFGPDGMLYLGLGDGGGSFDPELAGQDGDTLLAKLIRIDVDPVHGSYAIPADNPFVNDGSVRDEIWALGLRNPWRISFDSLTGDLYIGDVGQNQWEEISFQPGSSSGGENYGWSIMEGMECTGGGTACDMSGLTLPVAQYDHEDGDCSVTGGEVYRGSAYPNLYGTYFYADYCTGKIWGLTRSGNDWTSTLLSDTSHLITSFGLGEDGSVYLASTSRGVFLISDGEVVPEGFGINAGLNDAWYNKETNGQGLLVTVFGDTGVMFVAWFTYDVERPPEDVTAILGEPGHRWLTAQGTFSGDTATLDVYVTAGGVFDASQPAPAAPVKIGTMTIKWTGCNAAVVSYSFDTPLLASEFPIERIALDNVALCQVLQ